jgi:molybdenum cofactor guanylyltransferase
MDDARVASVCGVILAGGAGSRMAGQDKGFVLHRGKPLIEHVLSVLTPQVEAVAISANRNLARYAAYGVDVWPDDAPDLPGPLAGIITALRRAAEPLVLTVPVDAPCPPRDLAARLARELWRHASAQIAVAHDGLRTQPLFALYRRGAADALIEQFDAGERAVHRVHEALHAIVVDFAGDAASFRNLNTPRDTEDLAATD